VYRLFETERGRKPWSGARQALEKANRDMAESEKAWKHEQESKKDR
jgi:dimethylaniline monooxygenase (N-oxide forming)